MHSACDAVNSMALLMAAMSSMNVTLKHWLRSSKVDATDAAHDNIAFKLHRP